MIIFKKYMYIVLLLSQKVYQMHNSLKMFSFFWRAKLSQYTYKYMCHDTCSNI